MQGSFVRKRGTSSWTAYFYVLDVNGQRRQRSKGGFATKGEARAYLNEKLDQVHTGNYVEPTPLTLADYLLNRWLPTIKASLRPSTFDSYERMLKLHVVPMLGSIQLQSLSADHLDQLYVQLLERGRYGEDKGLAPKTVRYIHATIQKALRDAERKRLIPRNIATAADPPKLHTSGSREMKTWTAEELRIFLKSLAGKPLEAAYTLAATTGMRHGEVLGLRWGDIDFTMKRLAVRQTITCVNYKLIYGTPKTAKGRRSIALDSVTLASLQAHRQRQDEDKRRIGARYKNEDLVFANSETGGPIHPDYFSQYFDRTVAKLEVPRIRLHDLRHTHASLGLAAGIQPKVMSERLGHATVAFTQDVYMHVIPHLHEEAADQMASLIFDVEADSANDASGIT